MDFKKTTIYLDESRIQKCIKLEKYWLKKYDDFDPGFKHHMSTSSMIQRCIDATYDLYFGVDELPFKQND